MTLKHAIIKQIYTKYSNTKHENTKHANTKHTIHKMGEDIPREKKNIKNDISKENIIK